jgi:hypothetical protein
VVGGPIVHLANGHPGKALASLGLRLVGPVLAAAIYAPAISCHEYQCDLLNFDFAAIALLVTVPTAIAIDAFGFARERRDLPTRAQGWTISPMLDLRAGGAVVGLRANAR